MLESLVLIFRQLRSVGHVCIVQAILTLGNRFRYDHSFCSVVS